jgi:hypothetical protein
VRRVAILIAALAFGSSAAQAQSYNVASGQSVKLWFFATVNPDCTPAGVPRVRVKAHPQHGRVTIGQKRDFVHFQPSNVRSACNTRRVLGTEVRYYAQRGYVGYDTVGAEVFYPNGSYRSGNFNINVR